MKLIWKFFIAVLIIGILLPFTFLKGKDGKPLMSFGNLKMPEFSLPDIPKLPDTGKDSDAVLTGNTDLIYEWKDSEGRLQFSNSHPPEGIEFTVREYDPNTNVIQSVEIPAKVSEVKSEESRTNKKVISTDGSGNIYSPEQIKKLIGDAKNVENVLNDRLKKQDAIIGQ